MLKKYKHTNIQKKLNRIDPYRNKARSLWGDIIVWSLLSLLAAFMALPLVYVIVSAFKPFNEIFIFPPRFFVRNPTLNNFKNLFVLSSTLWVPFTRYIFNSVFVTLSATLLNVIFASMAAFPLAKRDFPFKNLIFSIVVLSLMFVPQVTFFPQYIILSRLGWLDSYAALIFPTVGSALGLFLMKQFMEQIPVSLLEASRIDGAGEMRILFTIVMPNVKPAWLTLSLFLFQDIWNNVVNQRFIFSEEYKLLPAAISSIATGNSIARVGVGAAAIVFLMIPPIIIFMLLQSRVLETMAHAGIKE